LPFAVYELRTLNDCELQTATDCELETANC
jgi:hypothetical protein